MKGYLTGRAPMREKAVNINTCLNTCLMTATSTTITWSEVGVAFPQVPQCGSHSPQSPCHALPRRAPLVRAPRHALARRESYPSGLTKTKSPKARRLRLLMSRARRRARVASPQCAARSRERTHRPTAWHLRSPTWRIRARERAKCTPRVGAQGHVVPARRRARGASRGLPCTRESRAA